MSRDTLLFDINEAVLYLSALKPKSRAAIGVESIRATCFSMLLHASNVCALTGAKTDFATLAGTMIDAIAARLDVELPEEARADILSSFACMPPHADIEPALIWLRSAGYRTMAFTKSSLNLATTQIKNADLTRY